MAVAGLQGLSENTRKQLERYQAGYAPSEAVSATQSQMQQAQAAKPAAYTPGQSALTAKNTLQNIEASKPAAYSPSNTVLQAQRAMQNVEATKPGEYKPSSQVEQYMNAMAQLQANKPGAYQSKYQDQIDSIIQQILNPQGFKYEFNGDNLFKAYSDMYTQKGKQAAEDVQGQAAALTGGYGNSYGVTAGNQAYQQYLTDLYGVGMDLRDRAYQDYLNQLQNRKDAYGILQQADDSAYGRYRDTVGDYYTDLNYATDQFNNERNFDYGQHRDKVGDYQTDRAYYASRYDTESDRDYSRYRDTVGDWKDDRGYYYTQYRDESNDDYNRYRDTVSDWKDDRNYYTDRYDAERDYDTGMYQMMLNYWQGLAQIENADYNSQLEREEAIRQYNQNFEEDKRRYDQEWNHKLELEAAEAAAASASRGSSGGGSGKQYYAWDGKIYEKDEKTGKYSLADTSKITSKDKIDDTTVQNQLDHRRKNLGR